MAIAVRQGEWLQLNQDIVKKIEQKSQLVNQTQIRELLIGVALDIATMTDDELVFYPLAYLVQQTPVTLDEMPIQATIHQATIHQATTQQYSVPYKIDYFGKGICGKPLTLDVALMFNEMGLNGRYDTTHDDDLSYIPDFSHALNILLTHLTLTSDDIVNVIHYLMWAGQYRFSNKDLSVAVMKRINDWLNSIH